MRGFSEDHLTELHEGLNVLPFLGHYSHLVDQKYLTNHVQDIVQAT
jgi:hypothetical protein